MTQHTQQQMQPSQTPSVTSISVFTLYKAQELCESWSGRPALPILISFILSVDVKQHWTMHTHWSQFVPNMSTQHPRTLSSTSSSFTLYVIQCGFSGGKKILQSQKCASGPSCYITQSHMFWRLFIFHRHSKPPSRYIQASKGKHLSVPGSQQRGP